MTHHVSYFCMFFGRFGGTDPDLFIQNTIKTNVEPMFKVLKTTFFKKRISTKLGFLKSSATYHES